MVQVMNQRCISGYLSIPSVYPGKCGAGGERERDRRQRWWKPWGRRRPRKDRGGDRPAKRAQQNGSAAGGRGAGGVRGGSPRLPRLAGTGGQRRPRRRRRRRTRTRTSFSILQALAASGDRIDDVVVVVELGHHFVQRVFGIGFIGVDSVFSAEFCRKGRTVNKVLVSSVATATASFDEKRAHATTSRVSRTTNSNLWRGMMDGCTFDCVLCWEESGGKNQKLRIVIVVA